MRMVLRLALRNLVKNRWRSGLAIAGIAAATLMLIWNLGFTSSFYLMMIRGSTDVEIGHVQIQDRAYIERPAAMDYLPWDRQLSEVIEEVPGVVAVTSRVRLFGLVGQEERSFVGRIYGVEPDGESQVTVMADGVVDGQWLSDDNRAQPPAEVVIGRGLSRTLDVGLGEELVVIAEGVDGSMGDALLEVVGIMESGNSQVDRQAVLLHIDEAQFVAAMDGAVHEVVISVVDPGTAPAVARRIQTVLDERGLEGLQARPWQEVVPGLYQLLVVGEQANYLIYLIIFFIVGLGVLNALRMSARERRREFGVMLAVGLSRGKLFAMVVVEGAVLGVVGALVGGIAGAAMTGYFAVWGLDLGAFMEGEATMMGMSFSERIYFLMSWRNVLEPVFGLIVVTALCAVWPAVTSIRLNPRDSISGRQ